MGYKLLLVEDHQWYREFLRDYLLKYCDCDTVDVAENGLAGLEKLQSEKYDIMLLDQNMPKMKGLELLKECQDRCVELPVTWIISDSEYFTKEAVELGAFGYLGKSASIKVMKEAFQKSSSK